MNKDKFVYGLIYLSAGLSVVILAALIAYVFIRHISALFI